MCQTIVFRGSGLGELVFACFTEGADEVGGDFLPRGARGYASLGDSYCGVVFPTAEVANHFLHNRLCFKGYKIDTMVRNVCCCEVASLRDAFCLLAFIHRTALRLYGVIKIKSLRDFLTS